MTSRTAALRYARALFDVVVQESNGQTPAALDAIGGQLADFSDLITNNAALSKALLNPAVPALRKRLAVDELVKRANVAPPVGKLLGLLAERDRLALLPELVAAYRQRLNEYQNIVSAELTTASALSGDRVKQIERGLAKATGRTVNLSTRVDPRLIGGAITQIGSVVFDGSLTGQLERLKEKLQ